MRVVVTFSRKHSSVPDAFFAFEKRHDGACHVGKGKGGKGGQGSELLVLDVEPSGCARLVELLAF